MKTINTLTPLTPAVFYILLALVGSEKHSYEIMKQVKQDSQLSGVRSMKRTFPMKFVFVSAWLNPARPETSAASR